MSSIVQLKRSALSGKVPGTGSLNLGELALNTYDGKIFFRRSGSTDTVQEVITTNVTNTGSVTITGTLTAESIRTNLTGSFGSLKVNDTLTVNHGETIMSGSALVTSDLTILGQVNARQFNISVISSSVLFESGSSRFGNTSDDTHAFTGSVNVTGSLYLNGIDLSQGNNSGSFSGSFQGDGSGLRGVVSDDIPRDGWDYQSNSSASINDFNAESDKYHIDFAQSQSTEVGTPVGYKGFLTNVSGSTQILPTLDGIDFVVGNNVVASIGVGGIIATIPAGTISGSSQVIGILSSLNTYTGSNDTINTAQNTRLTTIESVTGSYETTGRGIVSGSSQISYVSISSIPSGIVSGSTQTIANLPTGTISGSIQVLGGTGIISSSAQLENTTITNLTITNLTTVNETASVIFSSGSNRFGDFGDDTHSFTGSVKISGSITTVGSSTATSFNGTINANNGVVSGSSQVTSLLPTGTISGSSQVNVMSTTNITQLATTGSNTFTGNQTITGTINTISIPNDLFAFQFLLMGG